MISSMTKIKESEIESNGRRTEAIAERQQTRINPRLVFTDPDIFFSDLLMEQNEQQ